MPDFAPRNVTPRVSGPAFLALHLGACSGLDIATSSVPTLATPTELAAFDVDGDGERDVVSVYEGSATLGVHRVGAHLGLHASAFRLEAIPGVLAPLRTGFVATFPREGIVAAIRPDEPRVVIHRGVASSLAVADFDRDGDDDIAIAGERLLLVFQDEGSFAAPVGVPLDPRPRSAPRLALTDLDRDGTVDILVGMTTGGMDAAIPDHVRAFRNASHGRLADETWYRVPWPERVDAGDLDGDGLTDAVAFGRAGVWISFGLGHGWLGPAHRIATGRMSDGLVIDIDGDTRDDVVALDDELVILRSVGPRRFAPPRHLDVGRDPTRVIAVDAQFLVVARAGGLTAIRTASP